jgi:hypothetical protein
MGLSLALKVGRHLSNNDCLNNSTSSRTNGWQEGGHFFVLDSYSMLYICILVIWKARGLSLASKLGLHPSTLAEPFSLLKGYIYYSKASN